LEEKLMVETVRTSLGLPKKSFNDLQELAAREGVSMAEMVRRSIATEKYLTEARDRGGRILIKRPESEQLMEVLFR
jgi:hypothetical protein